MRKEWAKGIRYWVGDRRREDLVMDLIWLLKGRPVVEMCRCAKEFTKMVTDKARIKAEIDN